MDVCDDVAPVHDQRSLPWHAQRDVQHRAVLGDVDSLAGEHRVAPFGHAGLPGQLDEQAERLVGHAMLRVVEVDARSLCGQAGAPSGVGGEELAEVSVRNLAVVGVEGAIRGLLLEWVDGVVAMALLSVPERCHREARR